MSVPHPKAPSTGVPPADAPTLPPQANGAAPVPSDIDETLAPAAEATLRPAEPAAQRIAGYEILGELGRGGMGVVYKARQPGLRRLVALKMILHADYAGKDDRTRFEREARALADLRHEGIVGVYEVGEHEGKPFFSLEYVEGGSLETHLAGTPLPPKNAARLVQQLASAMQVAHEAGIVHRDLKPANVLLAFSDASQKRSPQQRFCEASLNEAVPKITDFGLAKTQDEGGLSVSGAVLGTPSYMAPEQAQGKVHSLDARTDVYALGAILYECLTGRPPFKAATHYDTLLQVVQEEPVSVRAFQPKMPPDLETMCLKCLQKEPAKRYATARELADDLGRFLRGEPVLARPVGRLERGWRWCRRNPTTAGLLAGIALLLLTVAAVSAVLGRFAWHKAVEAQMQATDAREAEKAAVAAREEAKNKAEVAAQQTSRAQRAEEAQTKKADEASREAKRAQRAEQLASDRLYVSRLRLAQSYWQEGNDAAAREQLDAARDHRHTWEHRYLYTLMNHRGQRTFLGHTGFVWSVAFSPDGKRIASASDDRTVKVWDVQTGQEALTLKGHTGLVNSVAFSPDGKRIASASNDKTVKVWDAQTGQEALSLKGHTGFVTSVAFSPDGKRIASGSGAWNKPEGEVKVWDAQTGQETLTLKGHTHSVRSVACSPDGKRIASASDDRTVKVWDAQTGQETLTLKGHTNLVLRVAFSPDGKRIASASDDRTVKVWDAQTGQETLTLKGHTSTVYSVAFSPDGKRIVSGSGGYDQKTRKWWGEVKVWEAQTGQQALTLQGHTDTVFSMAFSPDGKRLASASADTTVKVWDAQTGQETLTLKGHTSSVLSVAFSPDGKRIASGSHDKTVRVWDVATGKELLTLQGHTREIHSVCFSPDGKRIAAWDLAGKQLTWNVTTGQRIAADGKQWLTSSPRSPDGRWFALAEGHLIHLVRLPDSKAEQQQGFRWWIDPDYRWHAEQAADSWKTNDWFAAAFHLGRQLSERPWDARLHARHAYALARLGRIPQAATHYVQAALLNPHSSPWPLDPHARQRGQQAAAAGAWLRAVADFALAAHQPHAPFDAWSDLLLARAAAAPKDSPLSCRELLDHFEKVPTASWNLVFFCRQVPAEQADARRLVQAAERLVAARRDASTLDLLGAALYRAGRFQEAARTLQEAIKVQGKGGDADNWLFLALAQQRLGRGTEARSNLARFEKWLKGQKFVTWQEKLRWRLLHEEARRLILAMPPSAD